MEEFLSDEEVKSIIVRKIQNWISRGRKERICFSFPRGKQIDERQFDNVCEWADGLKSLGMVRDVMVCHDAIAASKW